MKFVETGRMDDMEHAADRGITTIFLAVILCTGSVSGSDCTESLRRIQVDDISIG